MELDDMAAKHAELQHGVFTISQVRQHGGTDAAVLHRLQTGAWKLLPYRGVYLVAGCPWSWEQQLHALVLAAGPSAAASHRSAAALLGIPGFSRQGVIEVVTTRALRNRTPGAYVHSSRQLPPEHLTVVEAIKTTTVARTLVDLAGVLHPRRAERVLDNCLARRLVTVDAVRSAVALLGRRGRPGIAVVRQLLEERADDYIAPESGLEVRALEVIRQAGLPEPDRQVDVGDHDGWVGRVDLAYRDQRLVIEIDSDVHHSTLVDRRADHDRDRRLSAAGWNVERVTEDDLGRPDSLAARLRARLAVTAA
jgi:very-short-patch-repair endonuclease